MSREQIIYERSWTVTPNNDYRSASDHDSIEQAVTQAAVLLEKHSSVTIYRADTEAKA